MAGVNYKKMHGAGSAKAMLRHSEKKQREKTAKHANEYLDKTRTHLNKSISELLGGDAKTYGELCHEYDSRIAELDLVPKQNKRQDRTTLVSAEVPVPKDLPRDKYDDWFKKVYALAQDIWGEDNFLDGFIHYDEEHEYMHPETHEWVMSRVHMHAFFIPVTKEGRLVGKRVLNRSSMQRFNGAIETMTVRDYGVHFNTGEKTKSKKTVEQLKKESELAELEYMADELEKAAEGLKSYQAREDAVKSREDAVQLREDSVDTKLADAEQKATEKIEAANATAKQIVDDARTDAQSKAAEIKQAAETEAATIKSAATSMLESVQSREVAVKQAIKDVNAENEKIKTVRQNQTTRTLDLQVRERDVKSREESVGDRETAVTAKENDLASRELEIERKRDAAFEDSKVAREDRIKAAKTAQYLNGMDFKSFAMHMFSALALYFRVRQDDEKADAIKHVGDSLGRDPGLVDFFADTFTQYANGAFPRKKSQPEVKVATASSKQNQPSMHKKQEPLRHVSHTVNPQRQRGLDSPSL